MEQVAATQTIFLDHASHLLKSTRLAEAVLNVLFTMYDIDEVLLGGATIPPIQTLRAQPRASSSSSSHSTLRATAPAIPYPESTSTIPTASLGPFRQATEITPGAPTQSSHDALLEAQAQRLEAALDGIEAVSTSRPGFRIAWIVSAAEAFAPPLVCALVSNVWQKSVFDDHLVERAYQCSLQLHRTGDTVPLLLPPVTLAQKLAQDDRFYRVAREGMGGLPPETETQEMIKRVVKAFAKQADRGRGSGSLTVERTHCRALLYHPHFTSLFFEALKPTADCTGCCDEFPEDKCLRTQCGHWYCAACVTMLVETAVKDEARFPPKCCKQIIDPNVVLRHLPADHHRTAFRAAWTEFSMPPQDRAYCPAADCSAFLGSRRTLSTMVGTPSCGRCSTRICALCASRAHPGENCQSNWLLEKVRELAEKEQWKSCPRCQLIIEKTGGCNHMVCRCGQQFCYDCGVAWKKCKC